MLKSISSIHESDIWFRNLADATGTRPMSIDDLLAMVEPIQLSDAMPEEIRREFDSARDSFVCACSCMSSRPSQSWLATRSWNWRSAGDPAPPSTSRSPGLSRLLQTAIEKGYLKRADFEVPSPFGSGAMAAGSIHPNAA
jgi:hypothetical protein